MLPTFLKTRLVLRTHQHDRFTFSSSGKRLRNFHQSSQQSKELQIDPRGAACFGLQIWCSGEVGDSRTVSIHKGALNGSKLNLAGFGESGSRFGGVLFSGCVSISVERVELGKCQKWVTELNLVQRKLDIVFSMKVLGSNNVLIELWQHCCLQFLFTL